MNLQQLTVLALLVASGCTTSVPIDRRPAFAPLEPAAAVETGSIASIITQLNGLAPREVPVSTLGTTLRQVVTSAKDAAGPAEVAKFLDSPLRRRPLEEAGIDSEEIERGYTLISTDSDSEWFILIRGNVRIILPHEVVNATYGGQMRVFPGDLLLSLPYDLVIDMFSSDDFSLVGTATLTGPFIEDVTVNISADRSWNAYGHNDPLTLIDRVDDLMPNVAVHTRSFGGFVNQILVPITERLDRVEKEGTFKFERDFGLRDGDVVELTRLEFIPFIASGVLSPLPPVPTGLVQQSALHSMCASPPPAVSRRVPRGPLIPRLR